MAPICGLFQMQKPHSCFACTEGVVVEKRVSYCAPKARRRHDGSGARPTDRTAAEVPCPCALARSPVYPNIALVGAASR